MDFVNRTFAQVADLFKSMTPGARITTALLLVVVVVSVAYLFEHQGAGADAFLLGGEPLSAGEMQAVQAALGKAKLTGHVIEGNRIRVQPNRETEYMAALAESNAMPASFGSFLDRTLSKDNIFTSRPQQEARLKVAKQQELQNIISKMKGMESAAVMYDVEIKRGLRQENAVTASVSVKPLGGLALDDDSVSAIRHLVASSIAGLKPESVTVTDLNTHRVAYSGGGSNGLGGGSEDGYAVQKQRLDRYYTQRAADLLSYVKNVVVSANVELTTETQQDENVTTYDKDSVVLRSRETTADKSLESSGPGGRPGLAAQAAANQATQVGAAPGPKSSEQTSDIEKILATPITQKHTTRIGLTPKSVKFAVAVPSTYYEEVWAEKNKPAAGQPAKKPDAAALAVLETKVKSDISSLLQRIMPTMPDATVDPFPRVEVTTFQTLPAETLPVPSVADHALAWLGQSWSTLSVVGLAMFGLVMLRSIVRSVPAAAPTPTSALAAAEPDQPTAPAGSATEAAAQPGEAPTPRSRLKRRGVTGPSLRDELAELVKQDPDTAVNVLRNWIGSGA